MRLGLGAAAVVLLLATPAPAAAAVERFAVLVGNNVGERDEQNLRYAESDAVKVRDVLLDLGGFRAENVVLMQGADADAVRRAIITVNDRIRTLSAGTDAVLLVYYSGHADASALHLGDTRLAVGELERLVRGSAAGVRLLILDACRSGGLTRVKGGRRGAGFQIAIDEQLSSQGAIFLTSSAASEDAQESEDLRGSFFTHYLVSGLLGAADASGDGQVSLAEAYRYAYEHTLRASSRTLAGMQHPTFQYDLAGRGDLVLTRLAHARARRAWVRFPPGRTYLLLTGDSEGAVVAEVGARDRERRISVRPGRYFVRARGRDHLLEGTIRVAAGAEREVRDRDLERIEYARLVRKGTGDLARVHGLQLGGHAHTGLLGADPCLGVLAGYLMASQSYELGLRGGWCRSGFENDTLRAVVDELALQVRAGSVWDVGPLALGPILTAGGGLLHQRFDTRGTAESRTSGFASVGAGASVTAALSGGVYATGDAVLETLLYRQEAEEAALAPAFAVRLSLAIGWWL